MIPFYEVKHDIRAGVSNKEYHSTWMGGPVAIVLDQPNNKVIVDLTHWDEFDTCAEIRYFTLTIDEFMSATYYEVSERASYTLIG